jgi:transcriptional regulator with XRE-family HTH domain
VENRIREARRSKEISLEELAAKVGVSRTTIANYERHDTEPKLDTWKKLAEVLDTTVGYLQGLEDVHVIKLDPSKHPRYAELLDDRNKLESELLFLLMAYDGNVQMDGDVTRTTKNEIHELVHSLTKYLIH